MWKVLEFVGVLLVTATSELPFQCSDIDSALTPGKHFGVPPALPPHSLVYPSFWTCRA